MLPVSVMSLVRDYLWLRLLKGVAVVTVVLTSVARFLWLSLVRQRLVVWEQNLEWSTFRVPVWRLIWPNAVLGIVTVAPTY